MIHHIAEELPMMKAAKRQDYNEIPAVTGESSDSPQQAAAAAAAAQPTVTFSATAAATAAAAVPMLPPTTNTSHTILAAEIMSVDEAIDTLGTGPFQLRVLFAAGLCFAADR